MARDDDAFKRKIEEFKELGQEYRYRDQLMVQEFSLSMVTTSLLLNAIVKNANSLEARAFQAFGVVFLALSTIHLRHIKAARVKRQAAETSSGPWRVIRYMLTQRRKLAMSFAGLSAFQADATSLPFGASFGNDVERGLARRGM